MVKKFLPLVETVVVSVTWSTHTAQTIRAPPLLHVSLLLFFFCSFFVVVVFNAHFSVPLFDNEMTSEGAMLKSSGLLLPHFGSVRSRSTCSSRGELSASRAGKREAAICWCARAQWWDLRRASRVSRWLSIGSPCCQSRKSTRRPSSGRFWHTDFWSCFHFKPIMSTKSLGVCLHVYFLLLKLINTPET